MEASEMSIRSMVTAVVCDKDRLTLGLCRVDSQIVDPVVLLNRFSTVTSNKMETIFVGFERDCADYRRDWCGLYLDGFLIKCVHGIELPRRDGRIIPQISFVLEAQ
jgi:hypothetical protein